MSVSTVAAKAWDDVKFGVQHPATVRKALAAFLVDLVAGITTLSAVVHLPVEVSGPASAAVGVINSVVVFLTSNKVVAVTDELEK